LKPIKQIKKLSKQNNAYLRCALGVILAASNDTSEVTEIKLKGLLKDLQCPIPPPQKKIRPGKRNNCNKKLGGLEIIST
jgi:hypothetical protein